MKAKIRRSMVLILGITLLVSYGLLSLFFYKQGMQTLREEVRQEARYICEAVRIGGPEYLEELDKVEVHTRVTWIAEDGTVFYDSGENESYLENHKDREEVEEAMKNGSGEKTRMSSTKKTEMYYYALRMDDGTCFSS